MKSILLILIAFIALAVLNALRRPQGGRDWYAEMFPSAPSPAATTRVPAPAFSAAPSPVTAPVARPTPGPKPSTSAASPAISAGVVTCRKGGEPPRSLFITHGRGRYELHYGTPGNTEIVAWSQSSQRRCQKIRARIRRKLEAAGYVCASGPASSA
jgi:hypothetical protein